MGRRREAARAAGAAPATMIARRRPAAANGPRVRSPVTSPPSGQPAARRSARRAPGYGTTIARAAYGGGPIWRRGPVEVRRSPARVRRWATTRRRSSAKVPIARARTAAGPDGHAQSAAPADRPRAYGGGSPSRRAPGCGQRSPAPYGGGSPSGGRVRTRISDEGEARFVPPGRRFVPPGGGFVTWLFPSGLRVVIMIRMVTVRRRRPVAERRRNRGGAARGSAS